jgi:hypothetical protein
MRLVMAAATGMAKMLRIIVDLLMFDFPRSRRFSSGSVPPSQQRQITTQQVESYVGDEYKN